MACQRVLTPVYRHKLAFNLTRPFQFVYSDAAKSRLTLQIHGIGVAEVKLADFPNKAIAKETVVGQYEQHLHVLEHALKSYQPTHHMYLDTPDNKLFHLETKVSCGCYYYYQLIAPPFMLANIPAGAKTYFQAKTACVNEALEMLDDIRKEFITYRATDMDIIFNDCRLEWDQIKM
jgi:hypothetical protein